MLFKYQRALEIIIKKRLHKLYFQHQKKLLKNEFFNKKIFKKRFHQLSDCQGEICENVLNNPKVYNNFLTKAVKKNLRSFWLMQNEATLEFQKILFCRSI